VDLTMAHRRTARAEGVHLSYLDFVGRGADALLLHGLAGQGSEWEMTAVWLRRSHHVIALDQRGHGQSSRSVSDFSREAYVRDAIHVIEDVCRAPVVLVGQSMGGLNAFLVATRRPDLVRALMIIEATPDRNPNAQKDVTRWLGSWPLPFASLDEARQFFGGDTLAASTWTRVLERRGEVYWPQFEPRNMVASLADMTIRDYWTEWGRVSCPTLIVGGEQSRLPKDSMRKMAQDLARAHYVQIEGAGHDVHLDRPEEWQAVAEEFLRDVGDVL
jgi:pimeloyl-ACP methyl ester carboxylesterase